VNAIAPDLGHAAPDTALTDGTGRARRLSDFWRERPTILLFLRHFGCLFCRGPVVEMERHHEAVLGRGARLVAIGQGTGGEVERFCRRFGATFTCLGDPERRSYRAFGLPRAGLRETLLDPLRAGPFWGIHLSVRGAFLRASDWGQLPGLAVVDQSGVIRYLHRSRHAGDLPPASAVLAALDEIVGTA
jgi:peroxiredoxin